MRAFLVWWLGVLLCAVGVPSWAKTVRVLIYQGKVGCIYAKGTGILHLEQARSRRVVSGKDGIVFVDNRPYRGEIEVLPVEEGVALVNLVDLEDYLKGVLYNEVSHYWPIEALKAQAVVARSYALYRIENPQGGFYDLTAGEDSQVYRGVNAERYRLNLAIESTRGEVLTYEGRILPAFYHSCCGGKTEPASELWEGLSDILPINQSVEDPYCEISPHFRWQFTIASSELIAELSDLGLKGELVRELTICKRTASGRAKVVHICTEGGCWDLSGKDLRQRIGSSRIKSLFFRPAVVLNGMAVDFQGKGWGHGVGMCQWGAYAMALQGKNYKEILSFYYPGAELVKMEGD